MKNRSVLFFKKEGSGEAVCELVRRSHWEICCAESVTHALALMEAHGFFVGIALIETLNDQSYLDKLEKVICHQSGINWILIMPELCEQPVSGIDFREHKLIREHAYDFHTLPVIKDRLLNTLGHAYGLAELSSDYNDNDNDDIPDCLPGKSGLIGKSLAMQKLCRQIHKVSKQDCLVMLTGELGTGKERVARAIHNNSFRADRPFVSINCESLSGVDGLSKLFGSEPKASNPLVRKRIGLIESAQGGTLFLGGIGHLSAEMQFDVLRLINEKSFKRQGGTEKIPIDIRITVSNESDLTDEVRNGEFRSDLLFCLRVVRLELPPLRKRDGDILLLAAFFFQEYTSGIGYTVKGFSENALSVMQQYAWPGNVRELKNCINQAILLTDNRMLTPDDLALERRTSKRHLSTLEEYRAEADQDAIISAMRYANYNISKASKILNISRVTLYCLIEKYNLSFVTATGKPPLTPE